MTRYDSKDKQVIVIMVGIYPYPNIILYKQG